MPVGTTIIWLQIAHTTISKIVKTPSELLSYFMQVFDFHIDYSNLKDVQNDLSKDIVLETVFLEYTI